MAGMGMGKEEVSMIKLRTRFLTAVSCPASLFYSDGGRIGTSSPDLGLDCKWPPVSFSIKEIGVSGRETE